MAKTLAEKIAVMQAAESGETIESRHRSAPGPAPSWLRDAYPVWDWPEYDYRVKPREPRELFVNLYPSGSVCVHPNADSARKEAASVAVGVAVRFREVIED